MYIMLFLLILNEELIMKQFRQDIFLLLVFSSLALSACTTISFSEADTAEVTRNPYEKEWTALYLGRAIGSANVRTTCPEEQEVAQYKVQLTPGQWWVGFFTLGIYTPVTSSYWCE